MSRLGLIGTLIAMIGLETGLTRSYTLPWPHFNALVSTPEILQDVSFVLSGFRRVAADMAWVQMLQYVGSEETFDEHDHSGPSPKVAALLKSKVLRVTHLDPDFKAAYLFGSGILAWSPALDSPDDALQILQEGIQRHPDYWPFHTYVAAILFKKKKQEGNMTDLLERAVLQKGCPTLVKSILANYYKGQKRYDDAIRIWTWVLSNPDDINYHDEASRRLPTLVALRHAASAPRN